jgi:hypothetical protein
VGCSQRSDALAQPTRWSRPGGGAGGGRRKGGRAGRSGGRGRGGWGGGGPGGCRACGRGSTGATHACARSRAGRPTRSQGRTGRRTPAAAHSAHAPAHSVRTHRTHAHTCVGVGRAALKRRQCRQERQAAPARAFPRHLHQQRLRPRPPQRGRGPCTWRLGLRPAPRLVSSPLPLAARRWRRQGAVVREEELRGAWVGGGTGMEGCFDLHVRTHHSGVLANPKLRVILSEAHSGP